MIGPAKAAYSSSSAGVSGVYYEKRRRKWRVQICFRGKLHFLGYYATEEEAIKARIVLEKILGSDARKEKTPTNTNFR